MSGYVGDLSHSQEEALKKVRNIFSSHGDKFGGGRSTNKCIILAVICMQLRSAVLDISDELPETDDYFFLRWLRGEQIKERKLIG